MKRFSIIKPVENHPDHICCTECWQRGIEWGGAGEQERIIDLLENEKFKLPDGIGEGTTFMPIQEAIALIRDEN